LNSDGLSRLWNAVGREGMTLVPIRLYFNDKGMVKLKLGVAKGKKLGDKRETSATAGCGRIRLCHWWSACTSIMPSLSTAKGFRGSI